MVSTFLVSYPLGALFTRIPPTRPNIAHLYSIIISVFFVLHFLGMGAGLGHLLVDCTVTYAVVIAGRGSKMPWVVFGSVQLACDVTEIQLTVQLCHVSPAPHVSKLSPLSQIPVRARARRMRRL